MSESKNLSDLLTTIKDQTEGEQIELGEIVELFENRGFGPLLLVPALFAMAPTGAIPGVPTVCGLFIVLIAAQLLFGRKHPWLPDKMRQFAIDRDKFANTVDKAKPVTNAIDKLLHPRLRWLTDETGSRVVAVACLLLALAMMPLELLPMAVAVPATAIAMISLGFVVRDGLLMVAGLVTGAAVFALLLQLI